jgi:predicted MFS family arabinose efflux permease
LRAATAPATALAGALSLAVAMGIGRFAFTPLLPMMLGDGLIDLQTAGWLASANYLGYLAGALLCTMLPWLLQRWPGQPAVHGTVLLRSGLVATVLLTLGMALPLPAAWPWMRFAAGVASALVFVYSTQWCLTRLALQGAPALGGLMFTGPGAGIVASGLLASAMVGLHWRASSGWLLFGGLALLLSALIWRSFEVAPAPTANAAAATAPGAARPTPALVGRGHVATLTVAYGLAGFGYIITATFLPVIARSALPGSPWLDLFWPLFGGGVVTGALLATRLHVAGSQRALLAWAYLLQALGVATSLLLPTLAGFALGSLLLGLPFTAITLFAMQEVRRLRPQAVAATMGLLTAAYGLGQIVGPPLAARWLRTTDQGQPDFSLSLQLAAAALLLGAALFALTHRSAQSLQGPQ